MKYAVVATLFALAAAQTREDIPSCATTCLDDAVKSGTSCSTTDYACICPHVTELSGSASGCVIQSCGADVAVGKVLPAVQALCAAQGAATASTGSSASATSTTPSSSFSSSSASATSATLSVTSSVPVTTSWTSIPCDTTLASQTPTNNQTTSTTVPIAGAAGLSVGAAAVVLAVLAL
ncbi:hypothetical protein NHJ13734_005999 [Beauveria thailandica]